MTGKHVLKGIPGESRIPQKNPKLNSERNPESQKESLNDPKTRSVEILESQGNPKWNPKTHFSRESRIPPKGIPNPENSLLNGIPNPSKGNPESRKLTSQGNPESLQREFRGIPNPTQSESRIFHFLSHLSPASIPLFVLKKLPKVRILWWVRTYL